MGLDMFLDSALNPWGNRGKDPYQALGIGPGKAPQLPDDWEQRATAGVQRPQFVGSTQKDLRWEHYMKTGYLEGVTPPGGVDSTFNPFGGTLMGGAPASLGIPYGTSPDGQQMYRSFEGYAPTFTIGTGYTTPVGRQEKPVGRLPIMPFGSSFMPSVPTGQTDQPTVIQVVVYGQSPEEIGHEVTKQLNSANTQQRYAFNRVT